MEDTQDKTVMRERWAWLIEAAADLIEPKGAWTRLTRARNALGREVEPCSDGAVRWCAIGALERVALNEGADFLNSLRAVCAEVPSKRYCHSISCYNDARGRKQAQVVKLMRKAAARVRAGGAS